MMSPLFFPFTFLWASKDMYFFSSGFMLDKLCLFILLIFPLVFFIIFSLIFSKGDIFNKDLYSFFFFLVFISLLFCFSSSATLYFLIFLELSSFLMVILVFNLSKDYDKISSTSFMFLTNISGSVPFMFFSSKIFNVLNFCEVFWFSITSVFYLVSCFVLLLSKLPIFFLHFWLTKAHVSASGSGSMILASLILKIGSMGLYKFSSLFIKISQFKFSMLPFCMSITSFILFSILMNRFFDIKYMVACSSVAHMAFMFPSFFHFSSMGIIGSILMISGHGLISCFIFYLVTLLYESSFNRSLDSNKSMESLSKTLMMFLFFFFLLNLGFPPFISFMSEFFFMSFILQYSFIIMGLFIFCLISLGLVFIGMCVSLLFGKSQKSSISDFDLKFCYSSILFTGFTFLLGFFLI